MVSQTAQVCAAAKRGRLVFSLPWLLGHSVPSYSHKYAWPWGGLDQFWVEVKPGGGRIVYIWLVTVFGWFAGWALGSAQGKRSHGIFHHQHRLALHICKASWSTGAAKCVPNLLGSRKQASTCDRGNGSAGSDQGSIQLSQGNLLTCAFESQQDSKVSMDISKNSSAVAQGTSPTHQMHRCGQGSLLFCTMWVLCYGTVDMCFEVQKKRRQMKAGGAKLIGICMKAAAERD